MQQKAVLIMVLTVGCVGNCFIPVLRAVDKPKVDEHDPLLSQEVSDSHQDHSKQRVPFKRIQDLFHRRTETDNSTEVKKSPSK
ncbi:MAG: hypothetical protein RLZ12_228, partial [Bacillota bacterium]